MTQAPKRKRTPLSKELQVRVFRRDGWICRWCGRPVVFAPAMRLLELLVKDHGSEAAPAYYNKNWRRDRAPLLDHLGAVIDHVEAFSKGGLHDEPNFVTSCNKCNARKNSAEVDDFESRSPLIAVKGGYGEPTKWDGLTTLFLVLGSQERGVLTTSEVAWFNALKAELKAA